MEYKLHGYQPRPWGYEVRADITDVEDNHHPICMTWHKEPLPLQVSKEVERRIVKIQDKLDFEAAKGKELSEDFGSELWNYFKEVLIEVIKAVRQHPNVTLIQLKTGFETEHPDSVYSFEQYVKFLRRKISVDITFDQFKNYVINKKFEGID